MVIRKWKKNLLIFEKKLKSTWWSLEDAERQYHLHPPTNHSAPPSCGIYTWSFSKAQSPAKHIAEKSDITATASLATMQWPLCTTSWTCCRIKTSAKDRRESWLESCCCSASLKMSREDVARTRLISTDRCSGKFLLLLLVYERSIIDIIWLPALSQLSWVLKEMFYLAKYRSRNISM